MNVSGDPWRLRDRSDGLGQPSSSLSLSLPSDVVDVSKRDEDSSLVIDTSASGPLSS